MKLENLLPKDCELKNYGDTEISDVCYDSRKASPGCVFVALSGSVTDGTRYIDDAVKAGAVAVVSESETSIPENVVGIKAKNTKNTLAEMSARFYGNPSEKMRMVGITGTSGKTTVSNIIYSIYSSKNIKSGLIGTISNRFGNVEEAATHTTPQSADLQKLLKRMADCGVEMCAMEVSSHALDQGRVYATEYDCGVFLNIARDHLDYHKTPENYRNAKLKLFGYYPKHQKKQMTAIVNYDENLFDDVKNIFNGKIITFGRNSGADVYSSNEKIFVDRVEFDLNYKEQSQRIVFGMGGEFNVSNALAAAAVAVSDGFSLEDIKKGIENCMPVNGRFQSVDCGQDFSVIVDYAHTPDEIEKLLKSAKKICRKRIITVCGCGGNRDKGKRPIMGKIACDNSDFVIITSDNPRDEEPADIINDILKGTEDKNNYKTVTDRAEAIKEALSMALKDDLVVIAGKGHEDYQIIKGVKYHFDDKEQIRMFFGK